MPYDPEKLKSILSLVICPEGFDEALSVRDYLKYILAEAWLGDDFDGKRLNGDGHWRFSFYKCLIEAKHLWGRLDESGMLAEFSEDEAEQLVLALIEAM